MKTDWTFHGFAGEFDQHVREQLPWYPLATSAVALIARHYIPQGGRVYDIGASTGNMGRALADTLAGREAALIALDEAPDMVQAYNAPGTALRANAAEFDYAPFDVAICFLCLMFLTVPSRRRLLSRLRKRMRPGGAIIVMDKEVPPGGYASTILARLTWQSKAMQGVSAHDIATKEFSLAGVQRPLYKGELGPDAVEVFRYGDFAGWIIEE